MGWDENPRHKITLEVARVQLPLEYDAGAAATCLTMATFKKYFSQAKQRNHSTGVKGRRQQWSWPLLGLHPTRHLQRKNGQWSVHGLCQSGCKPWWNLPNQRFWNFLRRQNPASVQHRQLAWYPPNYGRSHHPGIYHLDHHGQVHRRNCSFRNSDGHHCFPPTTGTSPGDLLWCPSTRIKSAGWSSPSQPPSTFFSPSTSRIEPAGTSRWMRFLITTSG